jgi:adenylosuccinate lyase
MEEFDLDSFPVATQTYSRRQDLRILAELAGIAASLHKFALDFRLMQSPGIGEWFEPFGDRQVGSSTMPFKRNPILSENICSLARFVATLPDVAWQNAGQAILERSLDDSANRRVAIPEAFIATEEMLIKAGRIIDGMSIDEGVINRNLTNYGPFAATERLMTVMVGLGADRQQTHEWIREISLRAWETFRSSGRNPLVYFLEEDGRINQYVAGNQLRDCLSIDDYTGTAGDRALAFAETIRETISSKQA